MPECFVNEYRWCRVPVRFAKGTRPSRFFPAGSEFMVPAGVADTFRVMETGCPEQWRDKGDKQVFPTLHDESDGQYRMAEKQPREHDDGMITGRGNPRDGSGIPDGGGPADFPEDHSGRNTQSRHDETDDPDDLPVPIPDDVMQDGRIFLPLPVENGGLEYCLQNRPHQNQDDDQQGKPPANSRRFGTVFSGKCRSPDGTGSDVFAISVFSVVKSAREMTMVT